MIVIIKNRIENGSRNLNSRFYDAERILSILITRQNWQNIRYFHYLENILITRQFFLAFHTPIKRTVYRDLAKIDQT